MTSFEQNITVHFRQTDMAGITYFNEVFNIFHDTYEQWVKHHFGSLENWFAHPDWAVPLRQVHCDYQAPLLPFKNYTVRIELVDIGTSTFRLKTEILNSTQSCATLSTTHIFLDKKTKKSMPIPDSILKQLKDPQ